MPQTPRRHTNLEIATRVNARWAGGCELLQRTIQVQTAILDQEAAKRLSEQNPNALDMEWNHAPDNEEPDEVRIERAEDSDVHVLLLALLVLHDRVAELFDHLVLFRFTCAVIVI
jgi:hypothetical protein